MTEKELAIVDRIEMKLDIMTLMAGGLTRTQAELHVYIPRIHGALQEIREAMRDLTGDDDGFSQATCPRLAGRRP